jgi:hypothetical protein
VSRMVPPHGKETIQNGIAVKRNSGIEIRPQV